MFYGDRGRGLTDGQFVGDCGRCLRAARLRGVDENPLTGEIRSALRSRTLSCAQRVHRQSSPSVSARLRDQPAARSQSPSECRESERSPFRSFRSGVASSMLAWVARFTGTEKRILMNASVRLPATFRPRSTSMRTAGSSGAAPETQRPRNRFFAQAMRMRGRPRPERARKTRFPRAHLFEWRSRGGPSGRSPQSPKCPALMTAAVPEVQMPGETRSTSATIEDRRLDNFMASARHLPDGRAGLPLFAPFQPHGRNAEHGHEC